MASDINKMTRPLKLVSMLRKNSFPNHTTLEKELRALDVTGQFKISQKTIQRDVLYLQAEYNAPIGFDYHNNGYYLKDPDWRFEVPLLSDVEMQAVTLGARLAETVMPEPISGEIQQAADMLASSNATGLDANAMLISLVAQGARIPIPPAIFKEVFEAWETRQGLSVTYVHGMTGKIVRYVIEPHVLSFYDGLWYVKAIVVSQDGGILPERTIRTLAVNRFRTAVIYPAPFAPDMRLIREVNEGTLFNFPTVKEVVLRFKGKAVPYARENHDASQIEEQSDGSLLVTVRNAIDFKIVNLVLNEGGDVTVISPPELAQKVIDQAKAVIQAQAQTVIQAQEKP